MYHSVHDAMLVVCVWVVLNQWAIWELIERERGKLIRERRHKAAERLSPLDISAGLVGGTRPSAISSKDQTQSVGPLDVSIACLLGADIFLLSALRLLKSKKRPDTVMPGR